MRSYSDLEKSLLNDFQHGFPLSPRPFAELAERLGSDEQSVLDAYRRLQEEGVVSRIGPVFRPNRIGVSTLAAMAVPPDQLERVAARVSARAEVNHNYERLHAFNLWFVVTARDETRLQAALQAIEQDCGYPVMSLPMLEDYFIDLGFEILWDE